MRRALLPLLATAGAWIAWEGLALTRVSELAKHKDALLAAYAAWLQAHGAAGAVAVLALGVPVFVIAAWLLVRCVVKAFRLLNAELRHG